MNRANISYLDYLNVDRLIFDLLIFTIFLSTHPLKTNNVSSDFSAQIVWYADGMTGWKNSKYKQIKD